MRLTSIKLAGFKSFVDPTIVHFPSNLVAIVGPNGSGKSNVIDAVRWVMGESSAKYLRGESMADVIFNGSSARKPVGQASIELLFDNSAGKLGGEYAQYSQIAVKRVVTRDGQSNYFLNGSRCRRRDITDLFLGTGLGPRSYAIIMQDTISRLIEAKPEELRIYLEEAAGISKYKERRRETETRIQHTRENLERLTDLRDELGKQLLHLQRQAKAAERYKILKEEQRLGKAQLSTLRWRYIDHELQNLLSQIQTAEVNTEATVAKLRAIDSDFEQQHEYQVEVTEIFNQTQARYYHLTGEVARHEQSKQHYQQRLKQLQTDQQQGTQALSQAEQELAQDDHRLDQLANEMQVLQPEIENARESAKQSQVSLTKAETVLQQWQVEWDDFNQRSAKAIRKAEVTQTQLRHLEQRQQEAESRLSQLQIEKESFQFVQTNEEIQQLILKVNSLKAQQADSQQLQQQVEKQIQACQQEQQKLQQDLHQQRSALQQLQGQHSSVEALQQIALGQKDQAVNRWLGEQNLVNQPRLAQVLQVEPSWEIAVEIVLSGYLEAVCVENLAYSAEHINTLPTSNVSLICPDIINQPTKALPTETLATKVTGATTIQALLRHVYIAESLAKAIEIAETLESHESVVTREGVWLGKGWLRQRLAKDEKAGVLSRQQELVRLKKAIKLADEKITEKQQQLNDNQDKLRTLEETRQQIQHDFRQLSIQLSQCEAAKQLKEGELKQLHNRAKQVEQTIINTTQQRLQLEQEIAETRGVWQLALTEVEQDQDQRQQLLGHRDQYRQDVEIARQLAQTKNGLVQQLDLKLHAAKTQHKVISESKQRAQTQLITFRERCTQIHNQLLELASPLKYADEQLEQCLSQQLLITKELGTAREAVDAVDQKIRSLTKERQQIDAKLGEARDKLDETRLHAQTLDVKRQTLEEQLAELNYDLDYLLNQLMPEATAENFEQQLEEIEKKITRLSPINLAAIDECATVSERKKYLDAQDADLTSALNTLENAIRKIDRETRDRFKETYDKVNQEFQSLFPKIFVGGSAYLELTGEDMLETGVSVIARPPGKRNSTIHLLSGGEKALTALALVFSLFQLNPAPFCMLDEVDAPLDDANIGRFCGLVQEMSKTVQFIFISHNKLAIEMADHLTGVTMAEPGVSRLVAVDVSEAIQMAGLEEG
jgi:chromosome segregation protein